MNESSVLEVPATVENVLVMEGDMDLVASSEVVDVAPDAEVEVLNEAGPVNYEDMALRVALALKQIYNMGDQPAFLMAHPTHVEDLKAALLAMPDEAYPAAFKEHLGIFADENINPVKVVTQTDIEAQFLEQHFTANGVLPRLQHFLQSNQILLEAAPGVSLPVNIPVRITLETLRALYALELKERLVPQLIRPPMGAQIDMSQIRK